VRYATHAGHPVGKTRKLWTPRSVNYLLGLLTAVLESEVKQGHLVRNFAALVDRIPSDPKKPNTLTRAEVVLERPRLLSHRCNPRPKVRKKGFQIAPIPSLN
jgi:integrase